MFIIQENEYLIVIFFFTETAMKMNRKEEATIGRWGRGGNAKDKNTPLNKI